MSVRFFHRKKILPGVTVNIAKGGLSLTVGVRHMPQFTVSRKRLQYTIPLGVKGAYITRSFSLSTSNKRHKPQQHKPEQEEQSLSLLSELFLLLVKGKPTT